MTTIAATLLCDRKPAFPVSLEYLVNEPLVERIYLNVETRNADYYRETVAFLRDSGKPFDIDYWWVDTSWMGRPQFDQDTARFMPIAQGRNMALDWAITWTMMRPEISHLLFVDADVRPHPGGLEKLLALDKPIAGGLVPGRGAHSHVSYVFGKRDGETPPHVVKAKHGTSGYLLLARSVFEILRFRSGPALNHRGTYLCDDPAYADDSFNFGLSDGWYIDTRATADHVDDPDKPLTLDEAINGYTPL